MQIYNPLTKNSDEIETKDACQKLIDSLSGYRRTELSKLPKGREKDDYERSGNFFRAYNEIPTILSLFIVAYVITKTFSLLFTVITLVVGSFIVYKVYKQKEKKVSWNLKNTTY